MCILSVHAFLKGVGYYDVSVLSMAVMGFKKNWIWDELYPSFFWDFWNLFNIGKPLTQYTLYTPRPCSTESRRWPLI